MLQTINIKEPLLLRMCVCVCVCVSVRAGMLSISVHGDAGADTE